MNRIRSLLAVTLVASLPIVTPARAQEAEDHSTLTLGLGVAAVPSYEGSDDYRIMPVPQVRGKVHDFAFWTRGPALFVDLVPNRSDDGLDIQVGPTVGARFDRTSRKRVKDDAVAALGKLDTAIDVGGFVGIGIEWDDHIPFRELLEWCFADSDYPPPIAAKVLCFVAVLLAFLGMPIVTIKLNGQFEVWGTYVDIPQPLGRFDLAKVMFNGNVVGEFESELNLLLRAWSNVAVRATTLHLNPTANRGWPLVVPLK